MIVARTVSVMTIGHSCRPIRDTASASRTYARDVVEQPLEAVGGMMPVPAGAGIGVTLDRGFLAAVTESVEVLRR